MKCLVIGSGGREHAIVDALAASSSVSSVVAAPGHGGMREQAELVDIAPTDIEALAGYAEENGVELTIVGPEVPLSLGIVDQFRARSLPIVGPTREHARLEASKSFTKRLCRDHGIPTASFTECTDVDEACRIIDEGPCPVVVKADGLAAGKGVVVAGTHEEARRAARDMMEGGSLGEAGRRVVIEEFMPGEEASFHVFADGRRFRPMAISQDHKARFADDKGPNTGGMGAYSVDTILTEEQRTAVVERIIRPTLDAMETYSGILYAGLMLTADGPKLVEYNVRFGDPETQVILPRLKTDIADVFVAMRDGQLAALRLEWRPGASATVVLVVDSYPGKVEKGREITGLAEAGKISDVKVFHAGTRWEDGRVYTNGGRVLNVTAVGDSLSEALQKAYFVAEMIDFEGKDYRPDIGQKGLRAKR